MIFRKNKQVTSQNEPICNTDKNTMENSWISEIHELQDNRNNNNEQLKMRKLELTQISIPISTNIFNYVLRFNNRCHDPYDLSGLLKDENADNLIFLSEKLIEMAKLKRESQHLELEIKFINQNIDQLKRQLNIQ